MARTATHTEGGSWLGGGTLVDNCNADQRRMIAAALADIQTTINGSCIPDEAASLRQKFRDMLACALLIDCNPSGCEGLNGFTPVAGEFRVALCASTFSSGQNRVNAVLFHEMVHAAGGTELDAEAFENNCYAGRGATAPTPDDFPSFRSDRGVWVLWDEPSGRLNTKRREGGSWVGDPERIVPGTQLSPNFRP
jgi:hypothetical protein